jgi:hypothetical protein
VLTWFDLHTVVAPPAPTANWQHVEDGRITRIRVAFDPRALTGGRPGRGRPRDGPGPPRRSGAVPQDPEPAPSRDGVARRIRCGPVPERRSISQRASRSTLVNVQ